MNTKFKTIVQQHAGNFETLKKAFNAGHVCLMDCILKSTNEHVAVICAMGHENGEVTYTPFAMFLNGNPYEMLVPPTVYDSSQGAR
jgi:hypothetical protein